MALARICPSCQGEYGPEVEACPLDGRRLVSLQYAEQRLIGRTLDGKYTLLGLLGRGGIGVVFKARQHSMERPVALKVLRRGLLEDEASVRRFLREVQGAGRVMHPNTVTAFDFGQTEEGELYLVMELLEGRTLGEILAAEGRLAPERVVALLAGICDGLHAAHEAGVVHRDIKPENILVLPDTGPTGEFVKVVDFGLAQLKSVQGAESITKTGAICGTPAYMSPEQALDRPMDRRTDLYSLGVVAWQLLVGSLPFVGDSPMRLLLAHLHEAPPPLALRAPWVPAALAQVVMEALAKNPDDRPPTAAELKRRLLAAMGLAPVSTAPRRVLAGRAELEGQSTQDGLPAPDVATLDGRGSDGSGALRAVTSDGERLAAGQSEPRTQRAVTTGVSAGSLEGRGAARILGPATTNTSNESREAWTPPLVEAPSLEVPAVRGRALWVVGAVAVLGLLAWGVSALLDQAPRLPPVVPDVVAARAVDGASQAGLAADAAALVSEAPVSEAPTTAPPSEARVSAAPTTAPPSEAPASEAPASEAPASEAPPTAPPSEAPASEAPLADAGFIWIHSRPPGAEVRLDGQPVGTTPVRLPRPAAAVRIQLRLARHEVRSLRLDPQRTAPLQVTLRRLPEIVE
jgi:serine/threonine protein kinase